MVDDYEVGYAKPPRATQFKPGHSGNPTGRPKGAKNLATLVDMVVNEKVTIKENGKSRRVTKLEAAVKQLTNKAASGDPRALQMLLALVQQTEPAGTQPAASAAGSEADQDVMRSLRRRMLRLAGGGSDV